MTDGNGLTQPYRTDPLIASGFPLDHAATPEAALALHDTTGEQHFSIPPGAGMYISNGTTKRLTLGSCG